LKNAPLNQCQLISDINWLGQMCLNNALYTLMSLNDEGSKFTQKYKEDPQS